MAKRTTVLELVLPPRNPAMPAYQWLYGTLRAEILEGRLRPGTRLPGTRELAERYGLSRGTILNAFDHLKSEGYIEGSVGSGTYVSKVLPEDLLQIRRKAEARPSSAYGHVRRRVSDFGRRVTPLPAYETYRARAFRPNVPALDLFPKTLWAKVAARRLRRLSPDLLLGCGALGYGPLREAIADYLSTSRGVNCAPSQIAIISGVQEALDLTSRILLDPGDRVCMESPGFIGAATVFEAVGARISAVAVDGEGMTLPDSRMRGARLAYVTPAHQFPLGITMSLRRRLELLEWARTEGTLIFEDDYESEYRFSGRPIPALQGLDGGGHVLLAGSLNKVLFPSLRIGYMVIPSSLVDRFTAAKSATTRFAPLLEQAIVCDFIAEGHFARHLRRMREVYAERLSTLLSSARQRLAGLLEISNVEAGLQTVGWLRGGIDEKSAAKAAAARDVEVVPLSLFSRGRAAKEGLQLGFAAAGVGEIRRGVRELAIALEGVSKSSDRPGR